MRIQRPDGPEICMVTEPGIVGKIGMNSAGVGTCLNLLRTGPLDVGVPVHIVLRAVLDSQSIEDAKSEIVRSGYGKASNLLVANNKGECLDVEFAATRHFFYDPPGDVVTHTNHFLVESGCDEPGLDLHSSLCRQQTAGDRSAQLTHFEVPEMATILSDQSAPILRPYEPDPNGLVGNVGTVCTMIMDLAAGRMHVRKGNDPTAELVQHEVA